MGNTDREDHDMAFGTAAAGKLMESTEAGEKSGRILLHAIHYSYLYIFVKFQGCFMHIFRIMKNAAAPGIRAA